MPGRVVDDGRLSEGLWGAATVEVWEALPGMLINVEFASILLGKALPSARTLWDQSATQTLFGFTLSLGQYVIGMVLAAALVPLFDMRAPTSRSVWRRSVIGHRWERKAGWYCTIVSNERQRVESEHGLRRRSDALEECRGGTVHR